MVASLLRSRIFARSSVPLERQDILGQGKGKPPLWESHLLCRFDLEEAACGVVTLREAARSEVTLREAASPWRGDLREENNSELHPQRVHDISNRFIFWVGYRVLPEQFIHLHDVFLHSRRETSGIEANRRDPGVDTTSVEAQFKSDFKPGFETHLAAFLYTGG
nr:hypothetical protein Iba_chr06bCG8650 [Ipomoea batatas]GMD09295.1 hypothetical protein Iba_chr06dCG6780 [Ipomoea batatas]